MSILSLLVDKLEEYGLPLEYASKVISMVPGDVITLGLRLAFVGVIAGLVRASYQYFYSAIHRGKPQRRD
jgi:hypothetical protein